ncbi:hypothetical protein PIB30_092747, partial [Stylosanthes scabra]|nr:hypothetical protein [Stylosanthes scabra]
METREIPPAASCLPPHHSNLSLSLSSLDLTSPSNLPSLLQPVSSAVACACAAAAVDGPQPLFFVSLGD